MKKVLIASLVISAASACVIRETKVEGGGSGGGGGGGGAGPVAASFGATVTKGQAVKIVGLGPDDAFQSMASRVIGLECYSDSTTTRKADGYWAGPFTCGGQDFFFYQVSLGPGSSPPQATAAAAGWPTSIPAVDPNWTETAAYIHEPAVVQVVALSPEDAYKGSEGRHIGKVCRVQGKLNNNGGGYYGGQVKCQDGDDPYYFKAKMRILSR